MTLKRCILRLTMNINHLSNTIIENYNNWPSQISLKCVFICSVTNKLIMGYLFSVHPVVLLCL